MYYCTSECTELKGKKLFASPKQLDNPVRLTAPSIQEKDPIDESSHNKEIPQISLDLSKDRDTPATKNTEHYVLNNDVLVPAVKDAKVHVEFVEPQTLESISAALRGRNIAKVDGEKQKSK